MPQIDARKDAKISGIIGGRKNNGACHRCMQWCRSRGKCSGCRGSKRTAKMLICRKFGQNAVNVGHRVFDIFNTDNELIHSSKYSRSPHVRSAKNLS